ncbi:MAG TPA: cytochrome b/b6 domain-containing protein [Woeseiaceae bacterium]|nr:cytochrome b/b6 domain-containing protein [Woeseiaceae bacterium]
MATPQDKHKRLYDRADSFGRMSIALHWLIAGLIVLQFMLAKLAAYTTSNLRELVLLANHKSVGITILMLALVRVAWRLSHKPPPLPPSLPNWQVVASHISHWSLYALIFFMPVTGWLMSSASAFSVSWFNLFQLPDLVAPNPELKETLEDTHRFLSYVLLTVASLHIIAALKHKIVDKDGIMERMTNKTALALFAAVIFFGAWSLATAATPGQAVTHGDQPIEDRHPVQVAPESALPAWNIVYGSSHIRFTGKQAGATFQGEWTDWDAVIRFAADDLANSRFDVTIRTAAVNTLNEDRDAALADPEWFDSINYPVATYSASRFSKSANGAWIAEGSLTIKGMSAPVPLVFRVTREGERVVLAGSAELLRITLGVGTGEWEDTTWVGNEVTVEVHVEANAKQDRIRDDPSERR